MVNMFSRSPLTKKLLRDMKENAMQFIAKLHDQKTQFEMMVYPNMNHSINGCDIRYPLYRRVLDFFNRHLKH